MGSNERERDFSAYEESNYPGMIIPEMFNNSQDIGDGYPGLQGAVRNWVTWWLHSGNMDSGLDLNGYDLTGVSSIIAVSGTIFRGVLSPYKSSSSPFDSGTQDGEIYWNDTDESLYRWDDTIEAWIQIGT